MQQTFFAPTNLITIIRWSFLADLFWLFSDTPAALSRNPITENAGLDSISQPVLLLIPMLLLSAYFLQISEQRLTAWVKKLPPVGGTRHADSSYKDSPYAIAALAIFCGGLAIELLSYISVILGIGLVAQIAIVLAVVFLSIVFRAQIFEKFFRLSNFKTESRNVPGALPLGSGSSATGAISQSSRLLVALILVRIAALMAIFIVPEAVRVLAWGAAILSIPRSVR